MSAAAEFKPYTMNIELTTACPLRCPQCYCSLAGGKNIDLQTAVYWIKEGARHGVKSVMLSGGETLCYPNIYDVIAAADMYCGTANVALSGFGFTQNVLGRLTDAGVGGIFISLNGSTEAINAQTRDGFDLAISALRLLSENRFPNTHINWVMHNSNADDFLNVVEIAERYGVRSLVVMAFKPDSNHNLLTVPSKEQMLNVERVIKAHKGNMRIYVESCYSPMLALVSDTKLFGNLNVGKGKGCLAGRHTFSVNVDGKLSPCRHLEYFEEYKRLDDYWNESGVLHKIRKAESDKRMPCSACYYGDFCRPCLAVNSKLKNELFIGHETCPLHTVS